MQNGSNGNSAAVPAPLRCSVHSVAVQTADFEKALDFYVRILGLEVLRSPFQYKTRQLAWLGGGPVQIELYSTRAGMNPEPYDGNRVGPDHVAFVTDDLDALVSYFSDQNVKVLKGPLIPPSGDPKQPRVMFVEGPDGDELQFREPDGRSRST
jgi:catechol 2,3-dioxygenase-like lactoylglutathione lyase family enzyme